MSLHLLRLEFVADDDIDLTLVDDDGGERVIRMHVSDSRGIRTASGDRDFDQAYRQVPGPAFPLWPERLALAAHHARAEPLPTGADYQAEIDAARADVERRWKASRRDADQSSDD